MEGKPLYATVEGLTDVDQAVIEFFEQPAAEEVCRQILGAAAEFDPSLAQYVEDLQTVGALSGAAQVLTFRGLRGGGVLGRGVAGAFRPFAGGGAGVVVCIVFREHDGGPAGVTVWEQPA